MQCIKCGCNVPQGELFCEKCSLAPPKPKIASLALKSPPPSVKAKPKPKEKTHTPVHPPKKKRDFLLAFLICLLLTLSTWSFIAVYYGEFLAEKSTFKIQQADLAVKMSEIEQTEGALAETEKLLESTTEALEEAQASYTAAQGQLDEMAQNTDTMIDRKAEMEALTSENALLLELVQEAENYPEIIEDLKDEISNLNIAVDFMNKYVVFSNDDDTNLYHKFGCDHFSTTEFWAYNRSLAEQSGKTPCPDCCS